MHSKPENTKNCPRCGKAFACHPDRIHDCQCVGVQFSDSQRQFISEQYDGCLCRQCLLEIQVTHSDSGLSRASIKP